MSKSKKLVFFGNERLATGVDTKGLTLQALVKAGYQVAAVVVSHAPARSRRPRRLEIVEIAHAYHIPVLMPDKISQIEPKLVRTGATAGVLVAYGQLLPQSTIDIFPAGIINLHPSLLPKLRGTTPVETAILQGLPETGVSLMELTAEMDAGPVYAQKTVGLTGAETKPQLAEQLLQVGSVLLAEKLAAILDGSLKPKPQNESEAEYTKLISKEDGQVDFGQPAEVIERQIRAYLGWPKSRAKVHGHEVIITKGRLASGPTDGDLVIKCQPGYLEILELTAPSGRTMSGSDFIRGYHK